VHAIQEAHPLVLVVNQDPLVRVAHHPHQHPAARLAGVEAQQDLAASTDADDWMPPAS
jgi:hypothetical protein